MAIKPKAKRETQLIQEAGRRARDLADRSRRSGLTDEERRELDDIAKRLRDLAGTADSDDDRRTLADAARHVEAARDGRARADGDGRARADGDDRMWRGPRDDGGLGDDRR